MNAWSREDIIIAYALYCVTPLGKRLFLTQSLLS